MFEIDIVLLLFSNIITLTESRVFLIESSSSFLSFSSNSSSLLIKASKSSLHKSDGVFALDFKYVFKLTHMKNKYKDTLWNKNNIYLRIFISAIF